MNKKIEKGEEDNGRTMRKIVKQIIKNNKQAPPIVGCCRRPIHSPNKPNFFLVVRFFIKLKNMKFEKNRMTFRGSKKWLK